ncbi:MAG TPA: hypothetical protein VIE38_03265 [Gaiellaceae bacterium]
MAGVALTLVTFSIGLLLAVLVAGSASAKTSPKKTATKSPAGALPTPTVAPADKFSVINGTVNAASDHEIVGSSAFPNFTTGAVDNYYSMAHSHVDNSPFAEGTASPFDTGPVGQTAAAGNFQQPQYADARWPGGPDKATYGNQGGPYAASTADNNRAKADASEASNALSGPGPRGTKTLAVPKGFDDRLRQALGAWNTKWSGRLGMPTPKAKTPAAPVTVPSSPVKPPSVPVTTPHLGVAPPVTVPSPKLPSAGAMGATRSPASLTLPRPPASLPGLTASAPAPGGTESLLSSSSLATLVYKTDKSEADTSENNTCKSDTVGTTGTTGTTTTDTTTTAKPKSGTCILVLSGESSMGRVTLGGGQIVIEGIHVTASITNDGTTPSYKAAVSVASASIGGIPVTIDENGVHVAGQGQGLPYKQASDALNGALNKAGIQIFLVAPEVTNCSQTSTGTGGGTTTTTTTTSTPTSTSPDQPGGTSSCGQSGVSASSCNPSGTSNGGGGGLPAPPTPTPAPTTTQSSTTTTPSPCGQNGMGTSCDQTGTSTGGTGGGASGGLPGAPAPTTTTTTTSTTTSTTTTPGSCDQSGMTAPATSCTKAGAATGQTTASNDQSTTTSSTDATSPNSTFQFGPGPGTNNAGEETVTATGVHIVFTQPVSPPGVPAQFVEHILGEVFVDSLASPATPLPNIPFSAGSSVSSSSSSPSSCGGGHSGLKTSGSGLSAGGSSSGVAGSTASGAGSLGSSASGLGSTSPSNGTPTANSMPARFASALRKPLWLLLAYVVWQLLVIGTGWSLWNWRRGGTA